MPERATKRYERLPKLQRSATAAKSASRLRGCCQFHNLLPALGQELDLVDRANGICDLRGKSRFGRTRRGVPNNREKTRADDHSQKTEFALIPTYGQRHRLADVSALCRGNLLCRAQRPEALAEVEIEQFEQSLTFLGVECSPLAKAILNGDGKADDRTGGQVCRPALGRILEIHTLGSAGRRDRGQELAAREPRDEAITEPIEYLATELHRQRTQQMRLGNRRQPAEQEAETRRTR